MLQANVTSWRRDRLIEAGFGLPLASKLARDGRYDLHALIELVENGCPPELALRILAPLQEGTAA
ncbi:MAG TPA: hypothetical protein VKB64_01760 [Gaiellaceae bacterium]|nr:hypothetical protein [Gaiellaceae bacterium]